MRLFICRPSLLLGLTELSDFVAGGAMLARRHVQRLVKQSRGPAALLRGKGFGTVGAIISTFSRIGGKTE
jgi:hypothetical protein